MQSPLDIRIETIKRLVDGIYQFSEILCSTCKRRGYCPLEPKTVLECDKYEEDWSSCLISPPLSSWNKGG